MGRSDQARLMTRPIGADMQLSTIKVVKNNRKSRNELEAERL
jgi:hypothetical protein